MCLPKHVEFRECVTYESLISEINLKTFEKEVELGEGTLAFMKSSESFKHEMRG